MALDTLAEKLPDYAQDLKLNLSSICMQTELTPQQLWGSALTSAMCCGNAQVLEAVLSEATPVLSAEALRAAKAAAAIMGMNNVYYRFQHLCSNEKYRSMPARLRMNMIKNHGSDPVDFELWCLAGSAINACGMCIEAHERTLRQKGMAEETILAAVRVASVIHAVSRVMDAESAG